jgi:DNA-binding transcriptional LysR family regulator
MLLENGTTSLPAYSTIPRSQFFPAVFARACKPRTSLPFKVAAALISIAPRKSHEIMDVRQAVYLVSEGHGIAIISEPLAQEIQKKGIVVKAISDKSLSVPTCLVMRSDDQSPLAREFAHAFLSRFKGRPPMPAQLELSTRQRRALRVK